MKKVKKIERIDLLNKIINETPAEEKALVSRSLEIATQIASILEAKNLRQKDLALFMNKSESEISKWLGGFHNFTLRTIVKMETILGERIITTHQEVVRNFLKAMEKAIESKQNQNISASAIITGNKTQKSIIIPFHPYKLAEEMKGGTYTRMSPFPRERQTKCN